MVQFGLNMIQTLLYIILYYKNNTTNGCKKLHSYMLIPSGFNSTGGISESQFISNNTPQYGPMVHVITSIAPPNWNKWFNLNK